MNKSLFTLIALGTLFITSRGRAQAQVSNNETLPSSYAQPLQNFAKSINTKDFSVQPQDQNQFQNPALQQNLKDLSSIKIEGGADAGGGDLCEDRIKTIRDDIKIWITKGGAKQLPLPEGMSISQYSKAMLGQLGKAKIKCVGEGDPGFPVLINNTPKVCRYDRTSSVSHITCDFSKFQSMKEADQYILIHHEFAGLSGVEIPNGDDSDYRVSNHISENLSYEMVQKLTIKSGEDTYQAVSDFDMNSTRLALIGALDASGASKLLCYGTAPGNHEKVKDFAIPMDFLTRQIFYANTFYRREGGQPTIKVNIHTTANLESIFYFGTDPSAKNITSVSITSNEAEALANQNSGTILNPSIPSEPTLTQANSLICHLSN